MIKNNVWREKKYLPFWQRLPNLISAEIYFANENQFYSDNFYQYILVKHLYYVYLVLSYSLFFDDHFLLELY